MSEQILRLTQVVCVGDEELPRRGELVVPWEAVECLEEVVRKDDRGAMTMVRLRGGLTFHVVEDCSEIMGYLPNVRSGPIGFQKKERP